MHCKTKWMARLAGIGLLISSVAQAYNESTDTFSVVDIIKHVERSTTDSGTIIKIWATLSDEFSEDFGHAGRTGTRLVFYHDKSATPDHSNQIPDLKQLDRYDYSICDDSTYGGNVRVEIKHSYPLTNTTYRIAFETYYGNAEGGTLWYSRNTELSGPIEAPPVQIANGTTYIWYGGKEVVCPTPSSGTSVKYEISPNGVTDWISYDSSSLTYPGYVPLNPAFERTHLRVRAFYDNDTKFIEKNFDSFVTPTEEIHVWLHEILPPNNSIFRFSTIYDIGSCQFQMSDNPYDAYSWTNYSDYPDLEPELHFWINQPPKKYYRLKLWRDGEVIFSRALCYTKQASLQSATLDPTAMTVTLSGTAHGDRTGIEMATNENGPWEEIATGTASGTFELNQSALVNYFRVFAQNVAGPEVGYGAKVYSATKAINVPPPAPVITSIETYDNSIYVEFDCDVNEHQLQIQISEDITSGIWSNAPDGWTFLYNYTSDYISGCTFDTNNPVLPSTEKSLFFRVISERNSITNSSRVYCIQKKMLYSDQLDIMSNPKGVSTTCAEIFGTKLPIGSLILKYGAQGYSSADYMEYYDNNFNPATNWFPNLTINADEAFWVKSAGTSNGLFTGESVTIEHRSFVTTSHYEINIKEGLSLIANPYTSNFNVSTSVLREIGTGSPLDGRADKIHVYTAMPRDNSAGGAAYEFKYVTYGLYDGTEWGDPTREWREIDDFYSPRTNNIVIPLGKGFWYESIFPFTWTPEKPY
jgi:hypothetical protein